MQVGLDILVYAVVAAIFLGRLWAVLGTRNEDEPQRPNPFAPPAAPPASPLTPRAVPEASAKPEAEATVRLPPPVYAPNSVSGGLAQIASVDPAFDEKAFLREAEDIFSTVVGAYAAGRLSSVAEFLSPDLMAHFQQAVSARQAAGQTAQTRIARIKDADVVAARAEGAHVFVAVRFVSDQENILRDAKGAILGGEEGVYAEVTDIWTFTRETPKPGARWVVVETRA